jgi:hypothetical protein
MSVLPGLAFSAPGGGLTSQWQSKLAAPMHQAETCIRYVLHEARDQRTAFFKLGAACSWDWGMSNRGLVCSDIGGSALRRGGWRRRRLRVLSVSVCLYVCLDSTYMSAQRTGGFGSGRVFRRLLCRTHQVQTGTGWVRYPRAGRKMGRVKLEPYGEPIHRL